MRNVQEVIESFFEQFSLEEINLQNVNFCFFEAYYKNKNSYDNDYGNLLHEVINHKYNEEKVLKLIDVLLEDGYDVNYQGKKTGYTFIHLALYGYTSDNEEYSYSTEFIVKLINLAKKYNFNVNLKDNDCDTIINTALASEVYSGKVIPLLKALGDDFDINAVDGNNNSILDALENYIKEAKNTNETWYNRLISEKEKIINYIKSKIDTATQSESAPKDIEKKKKENTKTKTEESSRKKTAPTRSKTEKESNTPKNANVKIENANIADKLKEYLKNRPAEEITIDSIRKWFNFSNTDNNNLPQKADFDKNLEPLLFEIFNFSIGIEASLKFIEVLLKNKCNVNVQEKDTGYSIIHRSLQPVLIDGCEYFYKIDSIIKLINLVKKYNFNVNLKDKNGNSIIHTAIASVYYTKNIIQLLEALGNNFDINCVDGNNNSIIGALDSYIKDAKNTNKTWYNQLISEKEEIINYLTPKTSKQVILPKKSNCSSNKRQEQTDKTAKPETDTAAQSECTSKNIVKKKNTDTKVEIVNITSKLEEYLKNRSLEEITVDSIKKWFNHSNTANNKLPQKVDFDKNLEPLLFEIIKFGFKEIGKEKVVLKFIEALLTDNNLNINVQEKDTGYSVVHKALEGGIIDNVAYSYSTDFIIKLINLVKEHNFNVNIRDNDGNSIMHTAIMSKCYAGEIIPILDALGENFKYNCVNKNGNSVIKLLLEGLKETKYTNVTLYNKLIVAEVEIKKRFNYKNIDKIELDIISNPKTRLKVIDMTNINIFDTTSKEFFEKNSHFFIDIIMNNILINLSNNVAKDNDINLRQDMFAILEAIDFLFLNFSHEKIKKNEQKLSTIASKLKIYSEKLTAKTSSIFSIKTYYAQKILLLEKTNETSYLQNLKLFLEKLKLTKEGYILCNYINKRNTIFNEVYGYEFEKITEISTFKALINQTLNFNTEERKLVAAKLHEATINPIYLELKHIDDYYDFFNPQESDNFNKEILKSIIKLIKDELEVLMNNCFKQEDLFLNNIIANINFFWILKSEFLICQQKIKILNLDIEIGEFLSSELVDKIKNKLNQAPSLYPDSFDNIEFNEEKLQSLRIIFEQLEMKDEEQIIKDYIAELIQMKNNILYYASYTGKYYQVLRFIRYMMFNESLSTQERIHYNQMYLDIIKNNPTLKENNYFKAMDNITLKMVKQ